MLVTDNQTLVPAREPVRLGPDFERDYPGASAVSTACVLNLVQIADRLTGHVAALAHSYGIPSATAFIVLEILRGAREPLPPYRIAERLFLHRATVTDSSTRCRPATLFSAYRTLTDRRIILIELTPTARQLLEELVPRLHRAERTWMAGLSADRQGALLELLVRLQAGLTATDASEGILTPNQQQ